MGDPGRPMIPIIIGQHKLKAVCDMGASMNVIPLSVYDDLLQLGALESEDSVVLPNLTTRRIEGYVDDICLIVGGHYVTTDFIVLNIGYNKADPIILNRPFLHTVRASIYLSTANMCFDINGTKLRFTFGPPNPRAWFR
jgi:hypothetical protein